MYKDWSENEWGKVARTPGELLLRSTFLKSNNKFRLLGSKIFKKSDGWLKTSAQIGELTRVIVVACVYMGE